jgi:hypothetical protein
MRGREIEVFTISEHLSSPRFSGINVTRSLVLCICFVDVISTIICIFVLWLLAIIVSVLRLAALIYSVYSDYCYMMSHDRNSLPFRSTWAHPRFSGINVTRSLVLCICFVDRCLSLFCYCVVCLLLALYPFTSFAYHFGVFKSFCSGVCVAWSLVFSVGLFRPLFVFLFFDFWSL